MNENLLKSEEKVIFDLRSLYQKYGYLPYQMSKFEEYELYMRHKEFMVSDRVITFNDTNGKLLALKPDVTLSIIKSGEDVKGVKQKVYYNENVYRVSNSTHRFKEIMQVGLECIGDTDLYDIFEVIKLASESLSAISKDYVLTVSHLGVFSSIIERLGVDESFKNSALKYISEKNSHDLKRLCSVYSLEESVYKTLSAMISAYGERKEVIKALKEILPSEELRELETISELLDSLESSDKIQFDFSLTGDTGYYNGFVFNGFIDGIAGVVLSGGQYDKMMKKMGRSSRAIGFAIYLDTLEQFMPVRNDYDVDMLVIYDESVSLDKVAGKISELNGKGFSCSAQREIPEKLRYKCMIDLRNEG